MKETKGSQILVTGAAGYIGSHFLRQFLRANPDNRVIAVDDLSTGHRESLPDDERVTFLQASCGDIAAMHAVFSTAEIEAVVHFAAFIAVGESEAEPLKYFENNFGQTLNLMNVMEAHDVRRMVFSSTCAVYGVPEYVPLDESHPRHPFSVYGLTKSMVEDLLSTMARTRDWRYVALRYFNCAGACESGEIGESHDPETHLIPNLLAGAAAGGGRTVEIFGQDYDTRDGTCVRDYIHVNDLASAHVMALELIKRQPGGVAINLGTTLGSTNLEVLEQCRKVTGCDISVNMAPRRAGDVPVYVAGGDRAAKLLGWRPQRDLNAIVETAWRWQKNKRF